MITHWQAVQEIALARGWTLQMLGVPHDAAAPHTPQLTSADGYFCLVYLYDNATRVAMVSTSTRGFTFLSYEDALRVAAGELTYGELAPAPAWVKYKPPGYVEPESDKPVASGDKPAPAGHGNGGMLLSVEDAIESHQR